jgi:nucleoside-diphosphate-sugar epimerase
MDVKDQPPLTELRPSILITGGAGFLGRALLNELTRPDAPAGLRPREIRILDTRKPAVPTGGLIVPQLGDVRSPADLRQACRNIDVVLHCAALVDWGQNDKQRVEAVNVDGTRNVIAACREAGVGALVHVSTIDVVYGGRPIIDGDESLPYPPQHPTTYCSSKAEAERLVLAVDGDGLRTTALRPCCMFGEADPFHVSSILRMARRFPVVRIGDGRARSQHVYVGNMAHALLLAARGLLQDAEIAGGKAYFITDFPAQNFFDYMEPIVTGTGHAMMPWAFALPRTLMYGLGYGAEGLAAALRPLWRFTPTLSRFAVQFICQELTFSGARASRELGYRPIYDEQQAFERTIRWFRDNGPV